MEIDCKFGTRIVFNNLQSEKTGTCKTTTLGNTINVLFSSISKVKEKKPTQKIFYW